MTEPGELPLGNDFEVHIGISAFNVLTQEQADENGRTITATFTATPTGAAIHSDLTVTLTGYGDGGYYGVIQGAAITERLAEYVGRLVYLRLASGDSDLNGAVAFRVTDPRFLA